MLAVTLVELGVCYGGGVRMQVLFECCYVSASMLSLPMFFLGDVSKDLLDVRSVFDYDGEE